ncbi:uncharacterized protein LOC105386832 [Plutella xylostella]|uniref:uncharacterized protein LOC105386832 n=1 Tax=Plutella xylostella TaxID=51655 RepID=UPI002032C332|nr:uncharacterized protein LOC105386832 [Plutella xylostella]
MVSSTSVWILALLSFNVAAAAARFLPRDVERLDDDDRELLRAAYDSPSYDHDNYEEDDDMKLGKLDLVKDGLWVIKAKIKELKAFDKALVANLLSTKLRLKDLMENHLDVIKKHHHEKPSHHAYQGPSYQYSAPEYHAPQQQQYAAPQQYSAPQYQPAQQYPAPQPAPTYQHDPYYGH